MKRITLLAVSLLMAITAMADGTIYFKNTLGWENVYVYFYTGAYWGDNGSGSNPGGTFASGPHGMTLVSEETDIYSFDYTGNYSVVAFTKDRQENYGNFYQTQAVYRQDFAQSTPLFVPNTTSNETKNQTQYFNNGEWEAYAIVELSLSEKIFLNESVTLTATSENVTDPVYVYSVKQGDGEYVTLEGNTWTPTATGAYTIKVEVKEATDAAVVASKEISTTVVNPIVAGTKLYLTPNANWKADNARFAAYFYVGMASKWEDMKKVEGTDMYEVTVPAEGPWTTVIFCRMNPDYTENQWNSGEEGAIKYVWNQSSDLTYDGTNNHYTIAEGAWDKGNGSWSLYEEEQNPTAIEETSNAPLFTVNGRTLNVAMDNEAEISIYTISGQMIEHTVASNLTREMQQGVYVVRIGNQSQKLVIF